MSNPVPTLNYSAPRKPRWPAHRWLRLAYWCGGLPMTAGVVTLLLWLVTYWRILQLAGVVIILGGVFLFFLGLIFVAIANRRADSPLRFYAAKPQIIAILLLLLNFPVAAMCIILSDISRIVIVNQTGVTIDSVVISHSRSSHASTGPIAPGSRQLLFMRIQAESSVTFSATSSTGVVSGLIDGYPEDATRNTVILKPGGKFAVQ